MCIENQWNLRESKQENRWKRESDKHNWSKTKKKEKKQWELGKVIKRTEQKERNEK